MVVVLYQLLDLFQWEVGDSHGPGLAFGHQTLHLAGRLGQRGLRIGGVQVVEFHAIRIEPLQALFTLASEASAFVVLVVGAACWRSRIVRSPRWLLLALGIVLVAAAMYVVVYVAIVIAISPV